MWAGLRSRYSDWLRVGRCGDRIPVGARFAAPVQTGPGAQTASCTMGTAYFPEVKCGRGVTLTPHPLLVLWSWKVRGMTSLSLWAVRPVQSLSACTRLDFTFTVYHLRGVGQDSSVGIATRYGMDGPGIESQWGRVFPRPPYWSWDKSKFLQNFVAGLSRG